MTAIRILFAAAFVYFVCLAAGQLFLRAIRLSLRRSEELFLSFITGAAIISSLVFALAACRIVFTSLLIALGAVIVLAWIYLLRPSFRAGREPSGLSTGWRILFWAPYLIFGAMYLLAAMAPEISSDGTGYHVGLITRYYDHRGFLPITSVVFAGLPEGIEMLFWIAFALGRHSAAAVTHLLFLLALPFGMLAFCRRIGMAQAGVIGGLLFYLAPVVGKDGTSAYIDVATAAVVFGVFFFLEIWRADNVDRALIPAGILAGFAYVCKLTAGTAAVYAVLYVAWVSYRRRRNWRYSLRTSGLVALLACAIAAPWLVKNIVQFRNPFFPMLNRLFPNPWQYPIVEDALRSTMARMNDVAFTQIPWQITVGGNLTGILGPVFLLAPLALLSLRSPAGRRLLLAFAFVFLPYFSNIGTRFLIPCLPFLALALAIGLVDVPKAGSGLAIAAVLLHAVLSWPPLIGVWSPWYQWRIDTLDLRAALRIIPEKQFLEQNWRDYKPGLLLDRFVPSGERVFSPSMGQLAYQHRELIGAFDSALGKRAFMTFAAPFVPEFGRVWRRELEFAPVATSRIRLVADSDSDLDLRVSELRFFSGRAEIPRNPKWRLTASSNPWEIQLAFDNSLLSWWTSGQRVTPDTWVEACLGAPVTLSGIVVEQNADQRATTLHPEVWWRGEWRIVRSKESGSEESPFPDLRMRVRDELKAMGIRWILIPDGSYGAEDLRARSPYWGITQIAEANGFRLWRLN